MHKVPAKNGLQFGSPEREELMSRIEQALEKAMKMRESVKDAGREGLREEKSHVSSHVFQTGALVVDIALVNKHIVTLTDPYAHVAEQYRKLRARILRATRANSHNTIMVTSADVGEGKSLTAINLAVALSSEIDHTVLLVDADLRNPSIHNYLGLKPRHGLSDYLEGKADLSDTFIRTGIGKLVLLPAGSLTSRSAELLSSRKMKMLVEDMKSRYRDRYIIFDSSPLLHTADPLSLGSYMDGILFVIQEGRTAQEKVAYAISLLKGCNILGAVFNNVSQSSTRDSYSYYYRRGEEDPLMKSDNEDGGDDAGAC
jgi:protein-tyrosine kinase